MVFHGLASGASTGQHQERTFNRQHFADCTFTDPGGGWTTQIDNCSPEVTYTFSDFRACPGGGPGDIRWDVTRRIMQDPSDPWNIIVRDTNGPEEDRCSFSGPGTTGTVTRTKVYDQAPHSRRAVRAPTAATASTW